jgi:hypothetical protein
MIVKNVLIVMAFSRLPPLVNAGRHRQQIAIITILQDGAYRRGRRQIRQQRRGLGGSIVPPN